jgi:hypothetical protein
VSGVRLDFLFPKYKTTPSHSTFTVAALKLSHMLSTWRRLDAATRMPFWPDVGVARCEHTLSMPPVSRVR